MLRLATSIVVALLIVACSAVPPTPGPATTDAPLVTPEPSLRHGVQGLTAALTDAGAEAVIADSFDGQPLAIEGLLVCVNGHGVRVYSYGTEQEAVAAAERIDRNDPSNLGTAIVEWDGWPQFWQRDRILVLFQGDDEATIDLLNGLLGEPFASGVPKPERLPASC